jgi:sugar lactone lactonase YvrE
MREVSMTNGSRLMWIITSICFLGCASGPTEIPIQDTDPGDSDTLVQQPDSVQDHGADSSADLKIDGATSDLSSETDQGTDNEVVPSPDVTTEPDAAISDIPTADNLPTDNVATDNVADVNVSNCVLPGPAIDPFAVTAADFSIVETFLGDGTQGFLDGPLSSAQINWPMSVVISPSGEVYVVDSGNHTIRKVVDDQLVTIAGANEPGFQDGPAEQARFDEPVDMVFGADGAMYISDYNNNRIRKLHNGVVTTVAGTGVSGSANGPGQVAEFFHPLGLAIDLCGTLYVVDSENHAIRTIQDGEVSTIAGAGVAGFEDGPAANARFRFPRDVVVDAAGTVYVTDTMNYRVRKISQGIVSTLVGSVQGYQDGPWDHVLFGQPWGIDMDSAGRLYVADFMTHRIRMIADNAVWTAAGSGGQEGNFTSPPTWGGYMDGPADSSKLEWPLGLAVHPDTGDIWVADSGNQRIRIIRRDENQ